MRVEEAMREFELEEDVVDDVFTYLDELQKLGITNMFGARPHICKAFNMDKSEAGKYLEAWMKTYEERHDV